MEQLQRKMEDVAAYHLQQREQRSPDLTRRLQAVERQIDVLRHETRREVAIPQRARLTRQRTQLLEELHKLNDDRLFDSFTSRVKRQIGMMIVEAPIALTTTTTSSTTSTSAAEEAAPRKRARVASANVPISIDEEAAPTQMAQDESASPVAVMAAASASTAPQHREFLLHFNELNLKVAPDTRPVHVSELTMANKARVAREQRRQLELRRHKHFCSHCGAAYLSTPNEARLVCASCSRVMETSNTIAYTHSFEQDGVVTLPNGRSRQVLDVMQMFCPRKHIDVPAVVYDRLKELERQNRYGRTRELTLKQLETHLKYLGYTDLCSAKYQIMGEFYNRSWPVMSELQEKRILFTFREMQRAFARVRRRLTTQREEAYSLRQRRVGDGEAGGEDQGKDDDAGASGDGDDDERKEIQSPRCDLMVYHICRFLKYNEFLPGLSNGLQSSGHHHKQLEMIELLFADMEVGYSPYSRDE